MEKWKEVEGFKGLYFVSNLGRIKNKRGHILTPRTDKDGYPTINLLKDGQRKTLRVHRIVAIAFVPNPDNKQIVDHLDTLRHNNNADNLMWATIKENNNNPLTRVRKSKSKTGKKNPFHKSKLKGERLATRQRTLNIIAERLSKEVIQIKDGEEVARYKSTKEAMRQTGTWYTSISKCCNGKIKTAGGFAWRYV